MEWLFVIGRVGAGVGVVVGVGVGVGVNVGVRLEWGLESVVVW